MVVDIISDPGSAGLWASASLQAEPGARAGTNAIWLTPSQYSSGGQPGRLHAGTARAASYSTIPRLDAHR
jgi:hypothetical protein